MSPDDAAYIRALEDDNARLVLENKALREAGLRCLALIEAMMPGVRNIALQNYQELNEAPIAMRKAIGP